MRSQAAVSESQETIHTAPPIAIASSIDTTSGSFPPALASPVLTSTQPACPPRHLARPQRSGAALGPIPCSPTGADASSDRVRSAGGCVRRASEGAHGCQAHQRVGGRERARAEQEARRPTTLLPLSRDAVADGPAFELAESYVLTGNHPAAIERLRRLHAVPSARSGACGPIRSLILSPEPLFHALLTD